jgi:enterochelin esterase-like enzyme
MKEKTYQDYLNTYRRGTEFMLTTDRRNGEVQNYVFMDTSKKDGKEIPVFRFMDGGETFDPEKIGGVEKIVSIEEVSCQQC